MSKYRHYVYLYREHDTGKCYIGQTINLKERIKIGYSHCPKFYNAIQSHIDEYNNTEDKVLNFCFDKIILAKLRDDEVADIVEEYYIQHFNTIENGYNTIPGGKNAYRELRQNKEVSTTKILNNLKNKIPDTSIMEKPDILGKKITVIHNKDGKDIKITYQNLEKAKNANKKALYLITEESVMHAINKGLKSLSACEGYTIKWK